MRILGASVLVMESICVGFALLLAMKEASTSELIIGSTISLLLFLSAGLLKRRSGWIIASLLQVAMAGYSLVVPAFAIIALIFIVLWGCAIYFGRKGEAIRAELVAKRDAQQNKRVSKERTLVLVKPDGVRRGLVGDVIARIERKGYEITALRMLQADRAILERHYAEHEGKPFYEPLLEFMMSGPIVALVAEGERVIEGFRSLAGVTDPTVAAPGTIRGDLARQQATKVVQNIVHGSDSVESAEREISIFFGGK